MRPLWQSTVDDCARFMGVRADEIMRPRRGDRLLSNARFAVWYVIHHRDGKGFAAIGRLFGGMDHSTIIHGVRKCADALEFGNPVITEFVTKEMARVEVTPDEPARVKQIDPAVFKAAHKPRNEISFDDGDAKSRLRGSKLLLAAIKREFPGRCAA